MPVSSCLSYQGSLSPRLTDTPKALTVVLMVVEFPTGPPSHPELCAGYMLRAW